MLKQHWPAARNRPLQNVLLFAISITRQSAAIDFLLEILAGRDAGAAAAALSALAIHKHNPNVRDRIEAIVKKRSSRVLQEGFAKSFAGKE